MPAIAAVWGIMLNESNCTKFSVVLISFLRRLDMGEGLFCPTQNWVKITDNKTKYIFFPRNLTELGYLKLLLINKTAKC